MGADGTLSAPCLLSPTLLRSPLQCWSSPPHGEGAVEEPLVSTVEVGSFQMWAPVLGVVLGGGFQIFKRFSV